jgi:hypothetical protein
MATTARIDDARLERLKTLLDQKVKYADIAEELGISYSSVAHLAGKFGRTKKLADHSEALPWKLAERHKVSAPAQYLRDLSRVAQGLNVEIYRRSCAIRWAQRLVGQGMDVAYDPEMGINDLCADGGFYRVEAKSDNPLETHIGRVLHKAMEKAGPLE